MYPCTTIPEHCLTGPLKRVVSEEKKKKLRLTSYLLFTAIDYAVKSHQYSSDFCIKLKITQIYGYSYLKLLTAS